MAGDPINYIDPTGEVGLTTSVGNATIQAGAEIKRQGESDSPDASQPLIVYVCAATATQAVMSVTNTTVGILGDTGITVSCQEIVNQGVDFMTGGPKTNGARKRCPSGACSQEAINEMIKNGEL